MVDLKPLKESAFAPNNIESSIRVKS